MTLGEILALYRLTAKDGAAPYFCSDAEIFDFINEAEEQSCLRGNLLFDKTSAFTQIAIVAATTVYPLDDSILSIKYATIKDVGGVVYPLSILDHEEMDRLDTTWRTTTQRPTAIIHMDGTVETNYIPDAAYTLSIEVYKLPTTKTSFDSPEIARAHHRHLLDWVLYKAYGKQDKEIFDGDMSAKYLKDFEQYFGFHPGVDLRKSEQINRPHRNKGYF